MKSSAQDWVNAEIEQFQREFGKSIADLLGEINWVYLKNKGKTLPQPIVDRNSLRWTLAWVQDGVSFKLNIVVNMEDSGRPAHVESVFVDRHASAPYDFEDHVPTTWIHRLNSFSITAIKEVVEVEFAQAELQKHHR